METLYKLKAYSLGLWVLIVFAGCASPRYMNKRDAIIHEHYSVDTLRINGYVFYDRITNKWGVSRKWSPYMSEDSVFQIFKTALLKSTKDIMVIEGNENFHDTTFHRSWERRFKSDVMAKIKARSQEQGKPYLVPLLKMTQAVSSGMYFTSAGGVGGSRYLIQNQLELMVYVIKDGEIIYTRSGYFLGKPYEAYELTEVQHTLTQQNWDDLVALLMKDYLVRQGNGEVGKQ